MEARVINKDNDNLLIAWKDVEIGFGHLTMKWDNKVGKFILDSGHLGVDKVIKTTLDSL